MAEGEALLQLDALLTRFYSSEVALVRSRTGDDPRPGTWSVEREPLLDVVVVEVGLCPVVKLDNRTPCATAKYHELPPNLWFELPDIPIFHNQELIGNDWEW